MCGRYRLRSDKQRIAEAFAVHADLEHLYLQPDDDIAPGSIQPVVSLDRDGERHIELMRWGFKLPDRLLFNARSEGIESAKFWKEPFSKRRCIIPADAFFEWQKNRADRQSEMHGQTNSGEQSPLGKPLKTGKKPKFEFTVPGRRPFAMAGLWSPWKNPKTDAWEPTFAILTGEANAVMRPIHDRQPTILEPRDYEEYLSATNRPPTHLLRILPEEEMTFQPTDLDTRPDEQPALFDHSGLEEP